MDVPSAEAPAFAGMTVVMHSTPRADELGCEGLGRMGRMPAAPLDSRVRGNDERERVYRAGE